MKPLWSDHKTEDDIIYHAQTDSDTVIYNLLEDIKCLKEDLGLTKISLEHKVTLLNSCEIALEREQFPQK